MISLFQSYNDVYNWLYLFNIISLSKKQLINVIASVLEYLRQVQPCVETCVTLCDNYLLLEFGKSNAINLKSLEYSIFTLLLLAKEFCNFAMKLGQMQETVRTSGRKDNE